MPPPKKPRLSDIDREDRVSTMDAIGEAPAPRSTPPTIEALALRGQYNELLDKAPYDNVPVPTAIDLATPESATEWVEQQVLRATPRAIQEVIHQMKRGDNKARLAAALQILDRAGVQAKDKAPQVVAPVFVLTQDALANIPWARKAKADGKIVDGKFTVATPSKDIIANAKKDRT